MNSYQQFNDYTVLESKQVSSQSVSKKFMASVFAWMFAALAISSILAFLFASVPSLRDTLYVETGRGLGYSTLGKIVAFAPLVFVLVFSFGFQRMSVNVLTAIFLLFAVVMGMSLSSILGLYTGASVAGCFVAASAMFGIMAVMGYTTDKDLTKFGSILMMGLLGMIVAIMINIFLQSSALYYIISLVGVAVFTGLTAYDVQKLKRIGAGIEYGEVSARDTRKLALLGALNLYLDFINIFLYLLRLFGDRRK